MLLSLTFLVLLIPYHSQQTTAQEKKTQAEHSHRSPLVNHSLTNPPTPNENNSPLSSAKDTHYLTSANRSLSDASSQKTSKKEESPSPALHPIRVLISNSWIRKGTTSHTTNSTLVQSKELELERGSPLVLTHQINLVPGACGGCEAEFATLRERLDHLEREVSTLKENCAGAEGAACFLRSDGNECPNDCSDQGRCEGGKCVCFPGFTGHDCGSDVCPSDCSDNGKCVNGQCVCDNGYSGLDCANKSCPGNCNNQGQCVKGKCVCRHGFTGPDCSTAPSGSVHLQNRNITDSSVTLFWNQPSVQYNTYHITFKSQREGHTIITEKVGGRLTGFTQTRLAAGQKYKVSIRGERDGKMGPESTTEFTTAPSGSVLIRSRDVTESSITIFWTQPSVQYNTYHITFKSQREGDEKITAKVGGRVFSFTQTRLAAGLKYKVSIRGERDGKMGPESTMEFTTSPSGSVHIRSRDVTESSVTLFWTQPSVQYSAYHITFKSQREGDEMITAKVGGKFTSFTQTGLAAGQKYKVSIRGERDGKMGPESTTEFTTAPSGSVHIRSRDVTDSSVTVFWTQPSVQYSTYHITFKSQREGDEKLTAKVGGSVFSFTQTRLAAGLKYKVSIRGERDGKMGPESIIEFTTSPSGSVHIRSRDVTESSVTLFWTQPSVQYSAYHITFKSQREGDEMITAKVGGRFTSFTQTRLAAGQKYKVSIRGERDGKMGPESTTEFTTGPSGSVHIRSRDVTDSSVTVFWTQPSVQYSTYHITFKSQRAGAEMIPTRVEGRLTSFTQPGLAAGQKYKVSIRGERDGKMGPESNTEFTTGPSGSVHIRSRDVTDSSVTVFWTQPSVQYSAYHITFKSQTEGDEMITAKVGERLTSFTQTRLAAGQKYKVLIRGERDGKMGPESTTEFTTAPSGSVHIRSRDVTDSSVTVFWTQPSVQYSTYHITFKSQRAGAEIIPTRVEGRLTSFTQPGLAAGQKYKVSIRGERDGKMGPESNTEFTTAPSGSVLIQSRDVTESSLTIFWTQPSVQYSTYHITFKSQREGDEKITAKVGGRVFSFTQTRLAAGQKYKVSIRGERDGNMGPESTIEFTTSPSGSVHIRSRDVTEYSVTLFWTQPSVQYSSYHITFKSQRDGGEMITAKVGGRLTSFTQTRLAAGQKYKVLIRGERDGKMGPESTIEFTTAPSGSVHLRSRDITDSSVTLFWTQPSVQYSTYHITFKSQRDRDEKITAKIGGRVFSFTQTRLAAGQKYKVSIRGERDGNMGPESTIEFTTSPSGSVHLRSRDITDSSVTLFWTQPFVQYRTYHITFKSQREGNKTMTAKVGGNFFSFTQSGLAASETYKVLIRGERDGKMGPESTTEFTTAPSGSVHLRSRDVTESSVTLFWTQPSVQYSAYHITFNSQRVGEKIITAKVGGRLTSFTQTRLAAGQKYKVSIRGERDGKMGPESTTEFSTVPIGSVHLKSKAVADSSVTLFWTQPSVQYSTYHITFKSQREGDEKITAKVGGRLTSFTQIGLVAGQKYMVSIRGERDGKMGPESTTEFSTASYLYLRSRDITESTVTLFWTQPSVQYSTYHITLKSQREGDKMITNKVGGRISSFTQTGLAAGQKYKVSIRGETDGKMGPESTTEFTTAPSGSIYFHTRDVTESSITLFWTQPSVQYSTYHIAFKSQREGDELITAKVGGRLTSFTQTGLAAGQKYKVSIKGERDGKMGPESNTVFTTAPSGSVHIRSRDVTDSSVAVFWTQPSVQYSTYHITFKSQREGDEKITAKVGGRVFSFTQTGLAAGLKYKVSIRGEKDGKMGPESTTEFTTAGSLYLRSRDITASTVTLSWTQPSVQYSTYRITFKSQREGDKMITNKVGGRISSFTQTGLAAGQKYKVSIRGETDGKMGPESTTEFTTAPSGSIYFHTRDVTESSVTLFWTQPSVQYSTYHITFKSQREGDEMRTAKVGGRISSFTQTGLAAGQKYKVSIRGERDGKMGPESNTEFTTAPSGSVLPRSRDITDSSVTLFWTQPSVQYSTYHITFKSQREGDEKITAKVGGRIFSFTQTRLDAGQKYKVSIRGERDGNMGPESTIEFTTSSSGSVHIRSRDVTKSSVTLFWTQPSVQYSTYHITFKSQREGDEMITAKVGGRLTSFTQTGLSAGQKYKVLIRGERDGKMGPESTTEFSTVGSLFLRSRDITESTVTLSWAQPSVQYSTYHITFKSQREGDKMITNKVGGRISSFTQTGLAAGQKYKVSIRGERDGKMGPESTTEFTTAPSGSIYFHTRDVTESSITLFWTQPSVQYSTYHIAFKSQRQGDKMIAANTEGRLTSFTQTGLVAGQKYKVSIRGERHGKMGPESTTEFSTAPSDSVHLRSRDVTESSVTLFWTQPSVKYSTYHITLKSQKEGDKMLTERIEGRLTSFTQTGLAAGQKYKVSIRGEKDGKVGPESTTEFSTDISGPRNLNIFKTTPTSVLVQWESPMGDIDSYHLSISPSLTEANDRKKQGQETTLPSDTDAANIDGLEEGCLYDITLIALKGRSQSRPIKIQAVPGNGKKVFNKMIVETVAAKRQPEGDITTEKKTSDKTTLDETLFLKKKDVTRGQKEWTKVTQPDSKHHSKVLPNPDLKTLGSKSTKTVEGQRKAHGTMVANTSGLVMHSTSVKGNTKNTATKVELTKSDRTSGHKTSRSEGDVTITEGRKATGPRKSGVTQVNGTERIHGSLGNGTTRYSAWTGSWKSGVENGTGQTYAVKQKVDSSWNVTGTLGTVSTTDSGPVVVERKGVFKTGGATKANHTVSEKVTDTKQVSQKGNVTKTEFSHNMATVQVMQGQSEDRELGTGGIHILVTLRNDTSIIRKGNQRVQSGYDAIQIDTATKISSSAPFHRNHTSSSKTRHTHGKIGHNDTSSQTGLNATIKFSSHHKNTSKTNIPQTDITSNRTRHLGSALNSVEVQNITSRGFIIIWEAPRGMFQSFVVTRTEYVLESGEEQEEAEEDIEEEQGEEKSKVRVSVSENEGRNITDSHSKSNNSTSVRVSGKNVKKVSQVIPGNARSLTFRNLQPHTRYSLTMFGMGSGLQSKIHHFTITTGPESPSELLFSNVTDSSLSVSWTKPKSPLTGFKITYTHTEDGESTSVSVDAKHSSVTLSQLSPGSSYEVSVVSVLGLKESDPVKGLVITVPDPPTDLRAVNVTDTKALLLWKPALATVDRYIILFGSEKTQDMTVKVSGNNAEHQLKGLHSGTVYTVTVTSQLDSLQSAKTTTTFTTAGGSSIRREEVTQEMTVSQVTPRSVVLSWKSPNMAVTSYRLTYQRAGQKAKEVILASTVTKFKLTGLSPLSKYTLRVQGERNGRNIAAIATEFKTGSLRFPFPTDCSQELLNGMQQSGEVEVFPAGRHGRPVRVYCDMETDGGGWTVFQRRMNGETNFFRGWSDYSYGFGNLSREFWLGNEHIHNLTILRPMALRVDLHAGAESYAHYSFFYIDGQRKHYALRVSGYSGTAGDSMRYYNGRPFSTHDKDPLPFITNGATSYRGGWWHKNCHKANMNSLYNTGTTHQGVIWTDWKGQDFSFPFTEMKLRPASFPSRTHS